MCAWMYVCMCEDTKKMKKFVRYDHVCLHDTAALDFTWQSSHALFLSSDSFCTPKTLRMHGRVNSKKKAQRVEDEARRKEAKEEESRTKKKVRLDKERSPNQKEKCNKNKRVHSRFLNPPSCIKFSRRDFLDCDCRFF